MKMKELSKCFLSAGLMLLAVVAALAFCPAADAFVPTRQDWTNTLPIQSRAALQRDLYLYVSQQQKGSFPFALAATAYGATIPTYTSPDSAGTIQDLLLFTNEERRRQGLQELRYNPELEKAAQRHAGDMAKSNYFSHDALDGSDLKDRVGSTAYRYTNVGENLFWRTPDNDPAYAVQGWMESPSHRKNLLDPQFTEIGFGYAVDPGNAKHYYVQVFGRPLDTPNVRASPQDTRESILRETNEARQRQGLPPFGMSNDLCQGAQEHAEDMMRSGELTSKLKRGSYDRFFTNVGARFAAREIFNDPHGAVQGWLDKGPQSDILSERFTETGIGYATDGDQHYYVQLFGTPMETGVGRLDSTRPSPRKANVMKAPGMGGMPTRDKKDDKARNGDFGKMGFGQSNRERRKDTDDIDDMWMDDKKVMETLEKRQTQRPVRRANPMGREYNAGSGGGGSEGPRPTASDGFNDDWNQDYPGTANRRDYEMGPPQGALMRQSRRMMPGGGGAGPMNMRRDMMDPRYDEFDLPPQQQQQQRGFDRRMDMNNGFGNNDGRGAMERGRMNSDNGFGNNDGRGAMDRGRMNSNNGFGNNDGRGAMDRQQRSRMNSNNGFGNNDGRGAMDRGRMNSNNGFSNNDGRGSMDRQQRSNNGFGNDDGRGSMDGQQRSNSNGFGNNDGRGSMDGQQRSNNGFGNNDGRGSMDGQQRSNNGFGNNDGRGSMDRQQRSNSNGFGNNDGRGSMDGQQRSNSNGRPIRRSTPSAFAGQTDRQDRRDGGKDLNSIHFQRHEQQMGRMGGMGMEEEMMFGPPPPGMRGQAGMYGRNQMQGPGMYGGNQMQGPGMYGRNQMQGPGMYGRNQMGEPGMGVRSSQMRDPGAYGRYDFGQPLQQRVGPMNDYQRGPYNIGMGGNSEFGRGGYYPGQYGNGMSGNVGVRPDQFGP